MIFIIARYQLFSEKGFRDDQLPPTRHTFLLHLKRANYQAYMWKHGDMPEIKPENIAEHGWEMTQTGCTIVYSEKEAAPKNIASLTACGCLSSQCRINSCSCRKKGIVCIDSCRCSRSDCCNDGESDESGDEAESEDDN